MHHPCAYHHHQENILGKKGIITDNLQPDSKIKVLNQQICRLCGFSALLPCDMSSRLFMSFIRIF
jgi:hypothetical protein